MAKQSKTRIPSEPRHGYPRPQLVRTNWTSLNGPWDFATDPDLRWTRPDDVDWEHKITVPFAPETPASGVEDTGFYAACWYRRAFPTPTLHPGQRLLLHLGAVDWEARVWVNGRLAGEHEGGYTPFCLDITELLTGREQQVVAVRAYDDPHDLAKPRGKQDWRLEPHSIWYYRTSGIWQTVWMEVVPETYIANVKWVPNVERWNIAVDVTTAGTPRQDLRLRVRLAHQDRTLADDTYVMARGRVNRHIDLIDPGIDDYRAELLWTPQHPHLIRAELELLEANGNVLDRVESYTAMRTVHIQDDRFVLNSRPYYLRLVLDQGYWPESGLTAPDDEALRRDVELTKAMGFNGVRKHQKIEDPRFLYWADTLGLLVWEEMPSPYAFDAKAVGRLTRTWLEALERDISHPCIIAWVPFNESWGVPDLPYMAAQRHFVQGVYHLTKAIDSTRPVIGNDGWESVVTDIIAIHDYDADLSRIARRYTVQGADVTGLFRSERPAGRALVLQEHGHHGLPVMLTEFGGIAYSKERGSWGYSRAATADDFAARYNALLQTVRSLPLFAGFCYTQLTDTYQEANGLLYMDRTPKFPIEQIAIATRGANNEDERRIVAKWQQRLASQQKR